MGKLEGKVALVTKPTVVGVPPDWTDKYPAIAKAVAGLPAQNSVAAARQDLHSVGVEASVHPIPVQL